MSDRYKQAGVDVEAGYKAVDLMKKHIKKTNRPEVLGSLGSFAGLFELTSFSYEEPVLVSGTDGVGTKLKLAFELDKHDTVGIDLVAMCVNDIVAQGADPLFFLDYIACGKNIPEKIEQIVKGIADGCVESGSALIGGETAEMPGMYQDGEYDLAGFVVGIADKKDLITSSAAEAGDVVIGIPSSGLHSNGFSLVRKIIHDQDLELDKKYPEIEGTLGETLLTPTRIYAKAIKQLKSNVQIKGISHITGGGFDENLPRAISEDLGIEINIGSWEVPAIYSFLSSHSDMSYADMMGVFNMGIGMAIIVAQEDAATAVESLKEVGELASVIGRVKEGAGVEVTAG